jgi:hypothetical protein
MPFRSDLACMPMIETLSRLPVFPAASGFLRWWVGELADIGRSLRREGPAPSGDVRIFLDPQSVVVERVNGDVGERFVEEKPLDQFDETAFAELGSLTAGARVRLCLRPPDIFATTIILPLAARSRLESAVALQMGEIAPLKPELLIWAIADRSVEAGMLHVRIVMMKRSRIDAIREAFEAHGLPTPVICAVDEERETPFPAQGGGKAFRLDMNRHGWAVIAALLLMSIPLTTLTGSAILTARAGWNAQALAPQVRDIRAAQHMASRMEEHRRLLAPLYVQPGAANILDELARRLPHDDWLRVIYRRPNGALSFTVVTNDEAALDTALRGGALLPGVRVSDHSPGGDDTVEVTYITDAR